MGVRVGVRRSGVPRLGVAAATSAGLGLRLAYVLGPARDRPLDGDAIYYHGLARVLADGHGFVEPLAFVVTGDRIATATHPPLFPLALALPTWLGIDTPLGHRVVSAVIGVAVVPLVALVAHRLAGRGAAVAAAFVGASYPALWMNDVNVLSESLLAPLVAAVLLLAVRLHTRGPTGAPLGLAVLFGALIGLATLTRAEVGLLLVLLAVPVLWRRPRGILAAAAAALVVVAPWFGYNLARFDETVVLSNNLGGTLASANCDAAWYGERIGWWELGCHDAEVDLSGDESVRDRRLRQAAFDFVAEHPARLPVVAAARVGRMWHVYRPLQTAELDEFEGRGRWPTRAGLVAFFPVVGLATVGARDVRSRRGPIAWLAAPLALALVVGAAVYGSPRFRVPADVALAVAAGIGAAAVARRASPRSRRSSDREPAALIAGG